MNNISSAILDFTFSFRIVSSETRVRGARGWHEWTWTATSKLKYYRIIWIFQRALRNETSLVRSITRIIRIMTSTIHAGSKALLVYYALLMFTHEKPQWFLLKVESPIAQHGQCQRTHNFYFFSLCTIRRTGPFVVCMEICTILAVKLHLLFMHAKRRDSEF